MAFLRRLRQATADPAFLVAGFLLLLANSAYLVTRADPTLFYFANVAAHLVIGLIVWWAFARHLRSVWREAPPAFRVAAALLVAGAVLGVVLMVTGATRAYRPVVLAHVGVAALGSVALLLHLLRNARRSPSARPLMAAGLAGLALFAISAGLVVREQRLAPTRHRIVNPATAPLSMDGEGAGPKSPFFPSSGETNVGGTIPSNFFMTSQHCARCHKDIFDQWNASAHHFSSFNNQWYRKSIEYMQDVVGTKPSKWCAGLPRPRGLLQRPLRPAHQGADRHPRGAGGPRAAPPATPSST